MAVQAIPTTIVSIRDSSLRISAVTTHMSKPDISGIAPFFIVKNVRAALSFYRDRLGFDITFQGPDPDDIFFGIVRRGAAMIMLKDVGVDPLPNYTRDVKKGWARWDAYLNVPDPDALAAEFSSRNVELSQPLKDDDDGLRGFELKDADGYVLFFGRPRS
jgi:catechol 2,3-dioxygenase-like lactoylglutathione lyase family enzyme